MAVSDAVLRAEWLVYLGTKGQGQMERYDTAAAWDRLRRIGEIEQVFGEMTDALDAAYGEVDRLNGLLDRTVAALVEVVGEASGGGAG